MSRDELPPGAQIGFAYDWIRQNQSQEVETKRKIVKLKKKMNKLSKKNKVVRRR